MVRRIMKLTLMVLCILNGISNTPTMKMKYYAFVEFKTGETNNYGGCTEIGYVTESILKKNKNQLVKVYCCGTKKHTKFVKRKNFVTIIPQY